MSKFERILENLTPEERKALKSPPLGNNELGAYAIFFQRKKYSEASYPKVTVPTPMDLWYDKEKTFYGRVDHSGDPLILDESFLKQIPSTANQNTWTLDFVADAFNDFKEEYILLNKTDTEGTPFQFLQPENCWKSATAAYDDFLNQVFSSFSVEYMSRNNRDQKMLNFDIFLKEFLNFVKVSNSDFPITFSQYILSNYSSPMSSGLMIELSNDSHSDDFQKYQNFINNVNFSCYARTARKYGFKIDKNYPGRMIADVKSPAMRKYFQRYPQPAPDFTDVAPEEPQYNPPPLPDPNEPSPWKAGDLIEITVIIPHDRTGTAPYFILNDYTLAKNTVFPAGINSKIYVDSNGVEHDEYDFLIKYFEGYGRPVKYILEVTNPLPQALIRQNTSVGGTNTTPANQSAPTSTGGSSAASSPTVDVQRGSALETQRTLSITAEEVEFQNQFFDNVSAAAIFGQETSYIEGQIKSVSSNFPGSSLSEALPPFEDQFFYSFSISQYEIFSSGGSPVYRKYGWSRNLSDGTFTMQAPIKSVHLAAIESTNSATVQRINDYHNYGKTISDYEFSKRVYDTSIWPSIVARYEQDLDQYNRDVKRHEQKVRNASRPPLTFDNFTNERYNIAYDYDIDMLVEFCMQLYHSYVSASPNVVIPEGRKCGDGTYVTKKKVLRRERITKQKINDKYTPDFWLNYYANIRNYENKNRVSQSKIDSIATQAVLTYRNGDIKQAIQYIYNELKQYS